MGGRGEGRPTLELSVEAPMRRIQALRRIRPVFAGPGCAVLASALLLASACGPRADLPGGGGSGIDLGSPPAILALHSTIPTPVWSLDGDQVVFPVRYVVQAQDDDANMRAVDIVVDYHDPCDGSQPEFRLTDDLPSAKWADPVISVDRSTVDKVRVPIACYPSDQLFNIALRVRDSRGNRSNLLANQVQVTASQGPGS
jgi:hypothetical protein